MAINDKIEKFLILQNQLKQLINEKLHLSKNEETEETTDKNNDANVEKQNKEVSLEVDSKINKLRKFVTNEINKTNKLVKTLTKNIKATKEKEESKEKDVVEKTKPVYLESFGDKALLELDNTFQKIFNIKVVQPKEQVAKKSKLWLVALAAIAAVIIAKFNDIKKYIMDINWGNVWKTIRSHIVSFLAQLPFTIINRLGDAFNLVKDVVLEILKKEEFQKLVENIKNTLIPIDLINKITTEVKEFFTDTIPNIFKSIMTSVKKFIDGIFSGINNFLGFKLFSVSEEESDKTDAIKAGDVIEQLNSQGPQPNVNVVESSGENTQPQNETPKQEPGVEIANNLNNFNKVNKGNVHKGFTVFNNKNTTLTPLHENDTAIILKEDGIIDKRLTDMVDTISKQADNYIGKFEQIDKDIVAQNDILNNLNKKNDTIITQINNNKKETNNIANGMSVLAAQMAKPKPQSGSSGIGAYRQGILNNG